MWICANDGFVSIVDKAKNRRRDLHVRARRRSHLVSLFPDARVIETPNGDYRYRADIPREAVAAKIAAAITAIDYDNFKNSVPEKQLHDAYARVWTIMGDLQPGGPYGWNNRRGGRAATTDLFEDPAPDAPSMAGLTQDLSPEEPCICEGCMDEAATWKLYGQRLCDSCVLESYGNHGRAAGSQV